MELTLTEALQKGVDAHKAGKVEEADRYYKAILTAQPKHPDANHNMGVLAVGVGKVQEALPFFKTALEANQKIAQYWLSYIDALIKLDRIEDAKSVFEQAKSNGAQGDGFDKLEERLDSLVYKSSSVQEPPKNQLQPLTDLYSQGQYQETLDLASQLIKQFPNSVDLYNIIGAANKGLGKLEEAIEAYKKALAINADYAEAYYNMGNALKGQGKLDEAIEAYNKAISFKSDYVEAYNNVGNALQEQGKLDEAIEAYKKALSIKPDYVEAILNASDLRNQISNTTLINEEFEERLKNDSPELCEMPKFQIQQAIAAFHLSNRELVRQHLNSYNGCTLSSIAKLNSKDQVFCTAYNHFLGKLIETPLANEPKFVDHQTVFHLGESHCLSYAQRLININRINYTVAPRITYGGKAYHFSIEKDNAYKAITKANFECIPHGSKVFISFGEIDCRPNEGFLSAASKLNRKIENLVSNTVKGYVNWFAEQNKSKNHSLFFFNVPAPTYNEKYTAKVNEEVNSTIKLFNRLLNKTVLDHDCNMIDVYKFTVGSDGFSNSLFHIDDIHLSSDALPKIEKQINTFL